MLGHKVNVSMAREEKMGSEDFKPLSEDDTKTAMFLLKQSRASIRSGQCENQSLSNALSLIFDSNINCALA
jgi:hypothetical protein